MLELLKDQEIQSNEGWARTYIKWLLTWRCWGISYFNILFNVAAGHQSLGWVHSQSMRDSLINGNGKLSFEETFNMLQYLLSKRWIYYFLFVIRHFEQYVFSKINAIEGCLLNIRQELETLDDTNDKKIFPSYLILSIEWP